MLLWQTALLLSFTFAGAYALVRGMHECRIRRRTFHLSPHLFPLGIFVWGDAIVFGAFWLSAGIAMLLMQNWLLALLVFHIFWLVRSAGETIYWFNQQFSTLNRNPPEKLPGAHWFEGDAIWFVYQSIAQCVTMYSLIGTIYFATLWIRSLTP